MTIALAFEVLCVILSRSLEKRVNVVSEKALLCQLAYLHALSWAMHQFCDRLIDIPFMGFSFLTYKMGIG